MVYRLSSNQNQTMTTKFYPHYSRRPILRKLEKGWTTVERGIDRLTTVAAPLAPYNPLYYLGQLAILLLIIIIVTGVYLTIFYRPGSDRAYQSVVLLSANWFGSLMRTSHNYASDALLVVIVLHALKMLASDRFWGSRWWAWITGWAMLALTWSLGLMGYWLVWDEQAQWISDWVLGGLGGPMAYSFFAPNAPSATFALFVIILFLHIFLPPLIGVGVILHLLRVARARYWTPRWLVGVTAAGLIVVSLALPLGNGLPADFSRLITQTEVDWLYVGFLPVVERLGTPVTWGLTLLAVGLLAALPWLRRGRHLGPVEVIELACTGCSACAHECPYDAVEMVERNDESGFNLLAIVKGDLCTGCGVCVGACPDKAIELPALSSATIREGMQESLRDMAGEGDQPVTIYLCDRHLALGSLPAFASQTSSEAGERINAGSWLDENGDEKKVLSASLPCAGMVHPNWASETVSAGGSGAIVLSCPAGDCANREGPYWLQKRLSRRKTVRHPKVHYLEVAPGSQNLVRQAWLDLLAEEQGEKEMPAVGWGKRAPYLLASGLVMLALLAFSLLPTWRVMRLNSADSGVRLTLNHSSQRLADSNNLPAEIADKLPPNVDPSTILGGERFPLLLRLSVNGEIMESFEYEPSGFRKEGTIYAIETVWLSPDKYDVMVEMVDDGGEWQVVFDERVRVDAGRVHTLFWQESIAEFVLRSGE